MSSPRLDNKTAAHFAQTFTMKLKGKLNTQLVKLSERTKPSLQLSIHPPNLSQPAGVLEVQQRAVISSLQYLKALVDRLGLDKPEANKLVLDQNVVGGLLGGASGRVLEAVQSLVEPRLHSSRSISTCLTRLYKSLSQLIRWTDRVVMLHAVSHGDQESSETVTTVIRAVLDGVKMLVRLVAERQEGSAPLTPVQSEPQHFPDRNQSDEEEPLAPPKPPKPLPQMTCPPALPPKKRQSMCIPAPCRVAIVTPMMLEPAGKVEQEAEDDCLKRLSSCSANSSAHSIDCDDDPDYNFLLTDLSLDTPISSSFHQAPALPDKKRRSSVGVSGSQTFNFDSAPDDLVPADRNDVTCVAEPSSPLSPSKTPPPLPEKKWHIHQYMQLCSSYVDSSPVMFYQKPPAFTQKHNKHLETSSAHSPAPTLPQKKKQQQDQGHTETDQSQDSSESSQQEAGLSQDEVLLTNQEEVLSRIIMKSEEEEGPDIKAASPEILLVHATGCHDNDADLYSEAFLCTYRSFICSHDLISKLQHRYKHVCGRSDQTCSKNTFQMLVRVVEHLSAVELESDLLLLLMDLVSNLIIGGELGSAHILHTTILSKMEKKWQLIGSHQLLRPLAAKGVAARPGTLLDFGSQDLAVQLTLLDSELFYKIELPEMLLWSKEQNEEKSPNLTAFTQHFNSVSYWVRSVIILQEKAQEREKLLLKFLKIMKHLRKLNNFNSYLSILSALDSAPLRRLDWQRSTSEMLEEFSSLIDSSSSFRTYRAALAEVDPPCIPYLGLILQDLTFVHLGNPDKLVDAQGSKVNFSKRWQQFNILDTVRSYQQMRYSLQPDDDIISFFNDFSDHLAEEALWELSLKIRPKNAPRVDQR